MPAIITTTRRLLLALAITAVLAAGCSSDDGDDATAADRPTETTETTDTTETTETTETTPADDEAPVVEVSAIDFAYEGLPDEIDAGTPIELVNLSDVEVHELVAVAMPDGEERSADELMGLPDAELEGLFGGPPSLVIVAPPSEAPSITPVGDGTLAEPGRYLVFCAIPVGADPDAFLAAAATSDGPPDVPGGPPHFVEGMYGDLTVR